MSWAMIVAEIPRQVSDDSRCPTLCGGGMLNLIDRLPAVTFRHADWSPVTTSPAHLSDDKNPRARVQTSTRLYGKLP